MDEKEQDEWADESWVVEEEASEEKKAKKEPKKKLETSEEPKDTGKDIKIKRLEEEDKQSRHAREQKKPKRHDSAESHDAQSSIKPEINTSDSDASIWGDAGVWRFATLVMTALLIGSIFTAGFSFIDNSAAKGALTKDQASKKALEFINLIQPGLDAAVQKSDDVGELYRLELLVAGQPVDSYITKDGRFLFPQGFDLSQPLPELPVSRPRQSLPSDLSEEEIESTPVLTPVLDNDSDDDAGDAPAVIEVTPTYEIVVEDSQESAQPVVVADEQSGATGTANLKITAKRWWFDPSTVKIKKGSTVKLTVASTDADVRFVLSEYSVDLDLTPGQSENTEFFAGREGQFTYSCADCEGKEAVMKGTLIVE